MVVVMADVDITSLSVEISAESKGAELNIDKLTTAIFKLRTKGSIGKVCSSLDTLTKSISALKSASSGMDGLSRINDFMDRISNVNLSESAKGIRSVASALTRISSVDLKGLNLSGLKGKMNSLQNGLSPLSKVDASGLRSVSSALNSIAKIPDFSGKLDSKTLDDFATSCKKITDALDPLASKIETVGNSFAKLPSNIQKVIAATDGATKASSKSAKSYMSLSNQLNGFMRSAAKLVSLKAISEYLGQAVAKFSDYYEAVNLFGVSMKELTGEASTFINKMETLLGIDPTEAMNNMATIQGLTTSFGMASDKAYVLSKNLTQLGYDLASLKNIPVAESFTKIQAAISGELEPIRRLGVDISNARLQQELLNLGYSQSVSTLSQADKAVLRYIAIMKQTTDAQGDFARTINSPANQIKILKAQLNSLARSVGSLLYPALKSILPPLIAAVELVKELVTGIASLMGVKVEFPDFSSASDAVGGVTDAMNNTTKATGKAAKAFKNYIMGFDELNVIQKDNGSSGGSGSGAGAAGNLLGDIDLSGYDMFKQYNEEFAKQIDSIKEKIRGMLPIIGAVTAALALWKLTTFIADIVDAIKKIGILKGMVAGGILIGIGFFLMFDGIKKAIQDKLNAINFAEILVGAITFVGGAALLGSKIAEFITTSFADSAVAKAITAAGGKMGGALVGAVVAGVIAGVAMFVTGVYDALTNGLNILNGLLIPAGSTMAGAAVGAIIGSLGGPIGAGIGAIIGLIVGGLTDAGIAIYQNWDKITAALNKASADLKQWFVGVGEWWDKKWKGFKTNWDKAWNSLADTLKALPKKFWDYGKNVVQGLIDGINNGIENAKKTVGGLAKAILDKFTTDTGIHSPSKVFWGFGGYIVEGLANGISGAKELAENAMQKLSDSVIALGQQLTQENYGMGDANIAMTENGDETSLEKTAMSLRNVLSNVGGGLTDWLKKIKSAFTDFSDGINAVSDVGKKISQGFTDSISALSNTSKSIVETKKAFKSVFSDMKTYVKSSIAEVENEYHYNGALSAAGLAIQKAFEGAYLALDKVSTAVKSLSGTIDSIKNVVKTFNDLKTKVGEVIDQVPVLKDAYNGLKTFFSNLFGMDSGIVKIVSDGWDLIKTKAGEALTFISGKIKALGVGRASGSSGGLASTLGAIGSTALPAGAGVLGVGTALGLGITGHVQWIKDLKNTWSDSSKSFGEKVFNTVNDTLTDIFNPFGAVIKIAKNKFGFAEGGFPDDGQLFLARESGPEFVGSMGGHTAVANNDQIVEGIREGVESAMAKQNELLRQQNELLKALLEKESTSEISVSSISQAISRVNQRNGKTIIPIGT
jgi:uncharacterized protein YoxC